jgi:UDP-3-O-[3-hydroxymyristoyl] N-acetylglucosamine deacetylase
MLQQRTISEKIVCEGIGLHSGKLVRMELFPAPEGSGINFIRTDLAPHAELKASIECVTDTRLATTLGAGVNGSYATVGTVEHLLAALSGMGIDNLTVHLDGPEIPVLDGSCQGFVEVLLRAGIERQRELKRFLVIKKEVSVREGDKEARLSPGSGLKVSCGLDFDHPVISPKTFEFEFSERAFVRELARARTFGFLKEIEMLRAAGLGLGGSLDNAVVIDEYRVLNPEGLRFPDEFARHKVLDAIGDLSLFGMPIVGRLHLYKSGHALNTQLVSAVLADKKSYEIVTPRASEVEKASQGQNDFYPVAAPIESLAGLA